MLADAEDPWRCWGAVASLRGESDGAQRGLADGDDDRPAGAAGVLGATVTVSLSDCSWP